MGGSAKIPGGQFDPPPPPVSLSKGPASASTEHPVMIMEPKLKGDCKRYTDGLGCTVDEDRDIPEVCARGCHKDAHPPPFFLLWHPLSDVW